MFWRGAALALSVLLVAGCSSLFGRVSEVVVVDGCSVSIKGLSAGQVDSLVRTLQFGDDCAIKAVNSVNQ